MGDEDCHDEIGQKRGAQQLEREGDAGEESGDVRGGGRALKSPLVMQLRNFDVGKSFL